MAVSVTKEQIHDFLMGSDPMEHIIKIEGDYGSTEMTIIYRGDDGKLKTKKEPFHPFVWATQAVSRKLYKGDRNLIKQKMTDYGIRCKGLVVENDEGVIPPRMRDGFRVLFYAGLQMSFKTFLRFFEEGGIPIYSDEEDDEGEKTERNFICVSPIEQYMIQSGKRLFKGYDDYNDLVRLQWDLETEGLDPKKNAISQIGIRTNKGFEMIIPVEGEGEEKKENEKKAIRKFFETIKKLQPDVISGHNTENFDWAFIDKRISLMGTTMRQFSKGIFYGKGVYKKQKDRVLKLGGEMEYFKPTVMWGHNLTDSLHAVRRAQALDSDMKKADLKYVTKYSKINKKNRVYVKGNIINDTWMDESLSYAFNDENGRWFKIREEILEKMFDKDGQETKRFCYVNDNKNIIDLSNDETFEIVTGRYIVERYLLDDLWETDKVELRYNLSNFLITKMIPVSFEKACTMGTAAIWKYILLSFSYEYNLAVPQFISTHRFTGGLSRLLSVGYVDRIVKLDYNSLYPSILLSFNIKSPIDISGAMLTMLDYILSMREHYKSLKAEAGERIGEIKELLKSGTITDKKEIERLKTEQAENETKKSKNDKLQLPLKVCGNGFFGSYGSGGPFPWSDIDCAEETTCIGRQMLRLMISHFNGLGYKPIVGDSFTDDTPLFIKYKDSGYINICTIKEIISEDKVREDVVGREYDYSEKPYWVLSRNGWQDVQYVYRHKTNKDIYRIEDGDMVVDITEDHSLYDSERREVKPSEITEDCVLEYVGYENLISNVCNMHPTESVIYGKLLNRGRLQTLPIELLNANKNAKKSFLGTLDRDKINLDFLSKKLLAQVQYVKSCL